MLYGSVNGSYIHSSVSDNALSIVKWFLELCFVVSVLSLVRLVDSSVSTVPCSMLLAVTVLLALWSGHGVMRAALCIVFQLGGAIRLHLCGYWLGLFLSVWLIDHIKQRHQLDLRKLFCLVVISQITVYLCGLIGLLPFFTFEQSFMIGVKPFILLDALKLLGVVCLTRLCRVRKSD
ncbi:MAG: biotin transporter BioY [Pseudomonadota bacterium]|nr:biotin transporter BioY [Pseudomonadota bacterium]